MPAPPLKPHSGLRTQDSGLIAPYAVIVALEEELRHLRAALPAPREEWHAGRRYEVTALGDHPLILTRCGIGMIGAAAVTEATIGRWQPAALLNYGCTGAHRPDLLPGDLVIGARVVAYDNVNVAPDGAEQYMRMRYLRRDEQARADYLAADPTLLAAAERAAERLVDGHEVWPAHLGWPPGVPHRAPRHVAGTVASADRWNRSATRIAALVAAHDTHCEDMEAAAIALVCASHDVPFLTIKDISNNELLHLTDSVSFDRLHAELGRRAAALLLATLRDLAGAAAARD